MKQVRVFLGQTSEDDTEQEALALKMEKAKFAQVYAKLNDCFTDLKLQACETLEKSRQNSWLVLKTLILFAHQWSWLYLNLTCLSSRFCLDVLIKELAIA